jgi:hypothetical protein
MWKHDDSKLLESLRFHRDALCNSERNKHGRSVHSKLRFASKAVRSYDIVQVGVKWYRGRGATKVGMRRFAFSPGENFREMRFDSKLARR